MYRGDSFFTLGPIEAAGLVLVTGALVYGMLALARRLCQGGLARRLALAAALYWGFLWLAPQVYYVYYQLVFEGLPVQIVIGWPPGAAAVLGRLTFSGPATLAAHGQGVLGWALLVLAARPGWFARLM